MTYAFKDLALSCVGQFLQYFLNKRNKHVTVLVGTAGDTGSAAIESVRGLKWIDIIVMLPKGRCTRIQELQMTTVIEDNVTVFSVDGTSDEIDGIIRKLFADTAFAKKHNLMSLNSINWCRIMVQIAHFFYAYFVCATSKLEDSLAVVEVVVPTGGAGNITAGCIARKMGLPVQLVAAVNENDILHRTVLHGDFSLAESVKASLSSAMDIQEPYNLERIFWLLSGMDSPLIKKMMEEFEKSKRLQLPAYLHKSIKDNVTSCTVSDADVIHTIRHCWDENHYLLCPHTAVAVTYHYRQSDIISKSIARCCLATASAVKFPEAVQKAGLTPEVTTDIKMLEEKSTRFAVMKKEDEWEQILRDTVEAIAIRRES
ncbi:threonine synthase-like 2 isoform X2 [Protopterus annectens]|nr:threonine synthase-like 2 isoform X2 [Protopterus annectens]